MDDAKKRRAETGFILPPDSEKDSRALFAPKEKNSSKKESLLPFTVIKLKQNLSRREEMGRAKDIFEKLIKEGEDALDEFILTKKSEELFLDFKRSRDDGAGNYLAQEDRNNLAKAISGFGNSEGGVIVWGIYCKKSFEHGDVARFKFPIKNAKRFLSWLEGAISSCTIPPHTGVENRIIGENKKGEGYVVTYIPKSMHAPHQCLIDNKYYIRSGSSFMPTLHSVLAGMFGRRPQPNVFHAFSVGLPKLIGEKIEITVGILLHNEGPGIASDLFINVIAISTPADISFDISDRDNWVGNIFLEAKMNLISRKDLRLAPGAEFSPVKLTLTFSPPFLYDLKIEAICGCGQSPPYRFIVENSHQKILELYTDFLGKAKAGQVSKKDKEKFAMELWITKTEKRVEE